MRDDILYLSSADIDALAIDPAEILAATEAILREKAAGRTLLKPKLTIEQGPGHTAQAILAVAENPALALLKWVGANGDNARHGLPTLHATVILSDSGTGQPRTIMNATWLTGVRTAACSAAAARHLARPDSATVAFIGCGLQARTHLAAFRSLMPGLRRAVLLGRSRATVNAFAQDAATAGLAVEVARTPADAIRHADIVVSTVPDSPELVPFLDPQDLAPGSFVTAVDRGRPWLRAAWRETFDLIATDDRAQSTALGQAGTMAFAGPYDAEIGDLAAGLHPGRGNPEQRTCLVFAGTALADLGLAALIDRRARDRGIGRMLPA